MLGSLSELDSVHVRVKIRDVSEKTRAIEDTWPRRITARASAGNPYLGGDEDGCGPKLFSSSSSRNSPNADPDDDDDDDDDTDTDDDNDNWIGTTIGWYL